MGLNTLKLVSLVVLIIGIILFIAGVIVYGINTKQTDWTSVLTLVGAAIIIGAIVLLMFSLQYDRIPVYFSPADEAAAKRLDAERRLYLQASLVPV